tara:strand:+ start:3342 stop:3518 length:177 start_codon:yes stop_codon:yes gene_type:complete
MKFKIGDLIRRQDGMLAMVIDTRRQERGIVRVQFYGVPKEHDYTGWHCDVVITNWDPQ